MKLEVARPVGQILIATGLYLILIPWINVVFQVWPLNFGNQNWRFGFFGYFLGAITMPTLGLGLVGVGGVVRESRGALRFLAVLSALILVVALVGLGVFLNDGSALKASGTAPQLVLIAGIEMRRTALITGVAIPVLAAIAIGSYNIAKALQAEVAVQKGSSTLIRAGGK